MRKTPELSKGNSGAFHSTSGGMRPSEAHSCYGPRLLTSGVLSVPGLLDRGWTESSRSSEPVHPG